MAAKHLDTGKLGETIACEYLEKNGYRIIHKGWRHKHLEVDVIIQDGPILVFVEVKTRSNDTYGLPFEAVDWKKQKKLDRAANIYISKAKHVGDVRFDIISILINEIQKPEITHIKDAFWPEA
jgi:putative endonuclease